ncbi:ABC transporter permease [Quadrisphaera sp. DSM 44207]|uniref:ABC transporter permease n=1 Tax=Quadrisphaera sp. DSM 44207 TaxID=1881057 RepID=UPI0008893435|nr:ABC transporter permease [Quadrisphaera sp. DSM 44207]SDQ78544.1 ABC-2 type transport system permease protein [Quadrisphaera sp. DSM 44207]
MSTAAPAQGPRTAPPAAGAPPRRRALDTRSAVRVVAAREIAVTLRDRAFLLSTAFTLLVVALAVTLPAVLGGGTDDVRVAVVGAAGQDVVDAADERAREQAPAGEEPELALEALPVADAAAAEAAVRAEEADVALVPAGDGFELVGSDGVPADAAVLLSEVVSAQRAATVAADLGATDDQAAALQPSPLPERTLEADADEGLTYLVGLAFALLFLSSTFGYGMLIAQRVTEEKQSRVVELLVAAVPVRSLLVGKVLATGVLALGQVVLIVGIAAVGAALSGQGALLQLIARSSGWFVVFFVAGFTMLACLFAAAGAMAPRTEDLQSTTFPLNLAITLPFFVAVFVTEEGPLLTALSYLPLTSPLVMPRLLALGDAQVWQALLSLGILLLTATALVVVSARLYERSLLRTRGKGSWRGALASSDPA